MVSTFRSYQSLKTGVVASGKEAGGKSTGLFSSISTIFGKISKACQSIPFVGSACSLVDSIVGSMGEEVKDIMVRRVCENFSDNWNDNLVAKSIGQLVVAIANQQFYMKSI